MKFYFLPPPLPLQNGEVNKIVLCIHYIHSSPGAWLRWSSLGSILLPRAGNINTYVTSPARRFRLNWWLGSGLSLTHWSCLPCVVTVLTHWSCLPSVIILKHWSCLPNVIILTHWSCLPCVIKSIDTLIMPTKCY